MIGNGHLDPVWLWQWPEGFQEAKATVRSALDRMNEFPDFIFTSSSAAIYAWIEENDPVMFAEVRARVAEGRWQLCGGWWIQPDCNIPGGESFVRQGLYGQRYFQEKFGLTATVGYNVDSFGHAGTFPQIYTKMGIDTYVFMRPGPHEMDLPGPIFWWESNDGARVLTYRIPFAYTAGRSLDELRNHILKNAGEARADYPEMMCFYGVGNHGGGPTIASLNAIAEWNEDPAFPVMIQSSPREFFDRVLASGIEIPVVQTDLQHHASGCYSAHSGIKRWNRQAENLLIAAEKWSTVASQLLGRPYPADLTSAWKQVLFNQFHDILAGTSLEAAYDDARDTYGEAMAIARRRQTHALHAIAWQIGIPLREETTPIVAFNPHAWPVTATVELEIGNFGRNTRSFALEDETGAAVPVQLVQSLATVDHWRHRIAFNAELPPLGYRTFHASQPETAPELPSTIVTGDASIENANLRLELDPATGTIARLIDKRNGVEVITGGGASAVVIDDPSDTWSHGVLRFDREIGRFTARTVAVIEHGPVRAGIRVESAYERSTITQDFLLSDRADQIEVSVTVDWREQFKALKLLFPLNLNDTRTTYEVPYGIQERPENGEEEPGQAWLDMTGTVPGTETTYGLSLLNDGKYSFHSTPGTLALTVLRSPIYAHHDPYVPEPDGHYSFMDQGIQHFTYVLAPHAADWRAGAAVRRAAELNQPVVAMLETFHAGPLPQVNSFASVEAESIVLSVLKQAEDGSALIARLYETAGTPVETQLSLSVWKLTIPLSFTPYEIKTVRIHSDGEAAEVDLLELPTT
jgi:alpha-mannosidase